MAAIQMAKAVERAEKLFEVLNDRFYNGEIAKAAITFAPDGGRNAYGWVTVQKVWQAGGERFHELNLCAEYLDMPIQEIAGIMLHEMAHLYNLQHGIEDTSNNGYYHNVKYKETAEAHGLKAERDKYGWNNTSLDVVAERWLHNVYGDQGLDISRKPEAASNESGKGGAGRSGRTGRSASKNRSRKYVCPVCGNSVRATKDVSIVCGDCGIEYQKQ